MGVPSIGGALKWMVYKGKSENKMDDLGVPRAPLNVRMICQGGDHSR